MQLWLGGCETKHQDMSCLCKLSSHQSDNSSRLAWDPPVAWKSPHPTSCRSADLTAHPKDIPCAISFLCPASYSARDCAYNQAIVTHTHSQCIDTWYEVKKFADDRSTESVNLSSEVTTGSNISVLTFLRWWPESIVKGNHTICFQRNTVL